LQRFVACVIFQPMNIETKKKAIRSKMKVRGSGSSEQVFHNSVWKSMDDVISDNSISISSDYSSSSSSYDSGSSSYDSGGCDCGGGCD